MAVNNSIAKKTNQNDLTFTYEAGGDKVTLSPSMVQKYLVSGDKGNVTEQEILMFISLCKYQKLNPFLREAYCIKYGSQPATMVVGKDVFVKRARRSADFDGYSAGIIVLKEDGTTEEREGSFVLPKEKIIGGWARVFVKNMITPYYDAVAFDEYAGRKKDGSLNSQWASKPATMIRKVALCHALREAFPDDFSGLYDASEMKIDSSELSEIPVKVSEPVKEVVEEIKEVEKVEEPIEVKEEDLNPPYEFDKEAEVANILFGGND